MTITSILCPVDFSPQSEGALRYAVALARTARAHLTVLTVTDPLLDAAARAAGYHQALTDQTQGAITKLLAHHWPVQDGLEPPAIAIVVGKPADEILKQATECRADVIVMGTQGLGGARKLVFGSTTERVLRRTTVPVLAVPEGPDRIVTESGGARYDVGRVLVPVDVTESTTLQLAVAGDWARLLSAVVRLLYVAPHFEVPLPWRAEVAHAQARMQTEAGTVLDELTARLGPGVRVEIDVRSGTPAAEIAASAAADGCGLIVLGLGDAHNRPGTTAYRVLLLADVPVLVVPSAL